MLTIVDRLKRREFALIDGVRRWGFVTDDSPKYLRKLVVEWGEAPEGVRVMVKEVPA